RSSLIIIPTPPDAQDSNSNSAPGTGLLTAIPASAAPDLSELGATPQTSQFLGQTSTPTFSVFGGGGKEKEQLLPATLGLQPLLSSLLPFPFPNSNSNYPPNLSHLVAKMVRQSLANASNTQAGPGGASATASISSKHSHMSATETYAIGPNGEELELSAIV